MAEIEYSMSGRRAVATAGGEAVGHVGVPDISFHWGEGVFIPLAGIGGVGTDQRFRRRGIASHLMKEAVRFAREHDYGGSAVSTGSRNVAGRLYSKAGYVHLFSMHGFSRRIEAGGDGISCHGPTIRPYEEKDLAEVLSLIRETERPFFGSRQKVAERWQAARSGAGGRTPALAFVALQDGEIVGYVDRIVHWHALTGEVFARRGSEQYHVGEALMRTLEEAAARLGEESLCFWATDCEDFPVRLLRNRGYQLSASRVFKFNILSLQRLVDQLGDLFRRRAAALSERELPASIELVYDDQRGVIELGGAREGIKLAASRDVVTKVVCGTFSAWDAYLRGLMDIRSSVEADVQRVLEVLLPTIPFQHPANDWW